MADKKSDKRPATGTDEPKPAAVPDEPTPAPTLSFDERGREMDRNLGRENRHDGDPEPAA